MGDTDLGTFSLFGTFRVPLGYSTPRYWLDTWVASADEVTTYSVSGASSSGALLQCSTKYCEVRISIGSLTEPPILRLGPNVEAAVTSISANNAVIIVKLDNPDTQFYCGGSASTRQCIVQRPPAPSPPPLPPLSLCTEYTQDQPCPPGEITPGFGSFCSVLGVRNQCPGFYCTNNGQCASQSCSASKCA